jgi:hypothetical protein
MQSVYVSPNTHTMTSNETHPLIFEAAALLEDGESISAVTRELWDLTADAAYASGLSGAAVVDGSSITQTVTDLEPRHRYRLGIRFQAAVGKVWEMVLLIEVPL